MIYEWCINNSIGISHDSTHNSNMTSFIGNIDNTIIKLSIYFNSHMRIYEQIINILYEHQTRLPTAYYAPSTSITIGSHYMKTVVSVFSVSYLYLLVAIATCGNGSFWIVGSILTDAHLPFNATCLRSDLLLLTQFAQNHQQVEPPHR